MALDTAFEQMMHVLSARGLDWFRRQIEELPDPLPADHPAMPSLCEAARFAPVCSGLRGRASPLEVFVRRRLDQRLVAEACEMADSPDADAALAGTLSAAQGLGIGDGRLHRAIKSFSRRDDLDFAERLALQTLPSPDLLTEAETWLRVPSDIRRLTPQHADLFGRVLMQIYGFGARRPRLSTPLAYGEVFANCLLIADWAHRSKNLAVLAQMIYCICLIDPDHDIRPWLAEVIASQRPDGSFPARTGFGTADQELEAAGRATIMAVAALHIALYRRWRTPPADRLAA